MNLPTGWDETPNEWRYRLRDPRRFTRIRPKRFRGVKGVYLVGGPLKPADPEQDEHTRGAYVEQAIRFRKAHWTLPAALSFQKTHYARHGNPPREIEPSRAKQRRENTDPRAYAPAEERAQAAAMAAIDSLVRQQTELSAALAQLREKLDRGILPELWELNRLSGARESVERAGAAVRAAVARHGAVIEEFHVPAKRSEARRRNPPRGGAEDARRLYREFHGAREHNAKLQRIPDLDRLVHLGPALEVHYRPAVARGPRNTPYRHEFKPGAQLLAPPGGGALVILGPHIRVSRAPRGRLGYIRG